jgi:hypothetical protein
MVYAWITKGMNIGESGNKKKILEKQKLKQSIFSLIFG